ncbi:hypothetical protein H5410_041784 [Solanum commersonii]|uniref:Uncharacterized protein n=1 Tax=Solanum commersonii TaxID=4109 RepID=A0A9J5XWK5_SOLCO|nr:hypothetical protein H5410_041784 [Solanum commersonii]
MGYLIAIFHHGGRFYKDQYMSNWKIMCDKIKAFYTENSITHNFFKLESNNQLYNFVKDLWSGSSLKEDLDDVSDQDDSEVDKELKAFRENLKQEKIMKLQNNELENVFTNKADKYNGMLGDDEEFIGSSNESSEDSDAE